MRLVGQGLIGGKHSVLKQPFLFLKINFEFLMYKLFYTPIYIYIIQVTHTNRYIYVYGNIGKLK